MADRPTGTVTLLFTDIEGSTRLLQRLGEAEYARLLGEHHRVVRAALAASHGVEIKTEGDSFFAVFGRASDAIRAAVEVQRQLATQQRPDESAVAVRMGIHTGDVGMVGGEYVGIDIHRAARIAAAAHGGQVLLSATTHAVVEHALPEGVTTLDLGEHRLKDFDQPEHVFQLVIDELRVKFPRLRALATRFDLLPTETTTFVGRERELARTQELLDGNRLLTLTGPGGTGKTRLSQRLARDVADDYDGGVAFVQLAAISDPELVAPTIRQALGLGEEVGRPALDTLVDRLQGRRTLLVLDNFEQVLPAARVVMALLEATNQLKIIVTSRAVLHVSGEQEFPVPPLGIPDAADAGDLELLSQSEAVRLFMQRARTVTPDFELSAANAAAIVEICGRLDGLPLAIELAASRVKLLPPAALLTRLKKSLDLLQTTASDRTDRQRTLRGAIGWSYDLLASDERALFRQLGIFVGGWRLDDAEAVVAAAVNVGDVLEGLGSLIDQSLVRQVEAAEEARYTMLETIREYAREQLDAESELVRAAANHADRFAALAAEAEPSLTTGRDWLDRFELDQANIRAALAWLAEHNVEGALAMAGSLWRFWHRRGHLREGTALLADLLSRQTASPATIERARALVGLAGLVYWQTDYGAARRHYEEALAIAQSLADRPLEVEVLYSLAYVQAIEADWDRAMRSFAEAEAIYGQLGENLSATWALMGGGMVLSLRGDNEMALPIVTDAANRFRTAGNAFGLGNTLSLLERVHMQLGRYEEARAVNSEFLWLAQQEQDPTLLTPALLDLASIEGMAGRLERAAHLLGAGGRVIDESGGQPPPQLMNRIEPLPVLRERVDSTILQGWIAAGRAMSTDEAVAYALGDQPGP
jgi:predicted ATPase/class 3 adenylate cyclase